MATIKIKLGSTTTTLSGDALKKKPARRGRPPAKERKYEEEAGTYPIEEHVILRMPENDLLTDKFREIVKKRREYPDDMEIEWKDPRRGIFKFNGETLFARLVDLPCILESQRTFDRRQFIKVCDISQMIVVERIPIPSPQISDPTSHFFGKPLSTDEFIENSGISPPLKYCRLRRFRKRLNKRTLESIEREVSRLLKEDARAEKVLTQFVDPSELDDKLAAGADEVNEDDLINVDDYEEEEEGSQIRDISGDEESSVDSELAAELEDEIAKAFESDEEEEEEEQEEEENENDEVPVQEFEEEEDEEMDAELRVLIDQQKTLREEMRDLEEKINEKSSQKSKAVNPIIQKRFDDIIKKLESEKEIKETQLNELELKIEDTKQAAEEMAAEKELEEEEEEEEVNGNENQPSQSDQRKVETTTKEIKMSERIKADTFERQMTETLKIKGVKKMGDLIQHYKTMTEALDETAQMGLGDVGKSNYQHSKNMTLRFKKRGADYDELKKMWAQFESEEKEPAAVVSHGGTSFASSGAGEKLDLAQLNGNLTEIKSDKDLAIVISSMIQEAFYNPETGIWEKYDSEFQRTSFTSLGKDGWQQGKEDSAAREPINRKKNEEVGRLMESEFVQNTIGSVFEQIKNQVIDVKKKEVRHAVRNHVRFHLYSLIYVDSK